MNVIDLLFCLRKCDHMYRSPKKSAASFNESQMYSRFIFSYMHTVADHKRFALVILSDLATGEQQIEQLNRYEVVNAVPMSQCFIRKFCSSSAVP